MSRPAFRPDCRPFSCPGRGSLAPFLMVLQLCWMAACVAPQPPPNVVFIMVDDMGWADLGCYGGKVVPTPNIDALAGQGMRFTQAYSGCVVCAPARSTLMTGHHMGHASVRLNTGGTPLLDSDRTVAEVLRDRGYATGGFGKWGLGDLGTTGAAESQGFDEFYGYYHQIHAHYFCPEYLIDGGKKVELPGNSGFYRAQKRLGPFPRVDSKTGLRRQFSADLIKDRTLQFLHANRDRPFFCYAPWTPPHGEYIMPADDPAWLAYASRPWPMKARIVAAYNAMVDRHVGEVLATLEELGLADNTVVFFLSDHGADSRFPGILDSCGPLRGHKRDIYEGGIRVPLIVRWPGHIEAGSESDHQCYFPDVLPTLADLAGASTPAQIDGLSFLPTLLGRAGEQVCHQYLYWEWQRYDWGKRRGVEGGLMQAVRRGDWKAVKKSASSPLELYDLSKDLGETEDLAARHPSIARELMELMTAAHLPPRDQREPNKPKGRAYR